jgi:hypothetical protein
MVEHGLLLVHRASRSVERLVQLMREKGFEATVLSSRPPGSLDAFDETCRKLGVRWRVTPGPDITLREAEETMDTFAGPYRFAISVWEGHRAVIAALNRRIGAADVSPESVARVQDKLAARDALHAAGLSSLKAYRLDDPALPAAMNGDRRFIARPRRGAGSLLTAIVLRLDEAAALQRKLAARPANGDLFSEYFEGNEIFVEEFFEGQEFSLELVRVEGRSLSACWHEKTQMRVTDESILECAFASPAVTLSPAQQQAGQDFCDRVLDVLHMTHGCFHVELLRNAEGRWELIEVNARPGGGLVSESVYQRFGVRPSSDWIDVLVGRMPAPREAPRCGTFQQFAYPAAGRRIARISRRADVPSPDVEMNAMAAGATAQGDREDFAVGSLWRTRGETHHQEVKHLSAADYVSFEYEA